MRFISFSILFWLLANVLYNSFSPDAVYVDVQYQGDTVKALVYTSTNRFWDSLYYFANTGILLPFILRMKGMEYDESLVTVLKACGVFVALKILYNILLVFGFMETNFAINIYLIFSGILFVIISKIMIYDQGKQN